VLAAVVLIVIGVAFAVAIGYDVRARRRGLVVRSSGALENESLHHRTDINAVPYEPARHAGQRDWATYRRRDRKRGLS
jgi:hypothetical protein